MEYEIKDFCTNDPNKDFPGVCGCGVADTDTDQDGVIDCKDQCPNTPMGMKVDANGCPLCMMGMPGTDCCDPIKGPLPDGAPCEDGDQCTQMDTCQAGICKPGFMNDTDKDGTPDCRDECPADPKKISVGVCGCGVSDTDTDKDGTADCMDLCPNDPRKQAPGECGCGKPDVDTDNDGTLDCKDQCPNDAGRILPGLCGCGAPAAGETDTDRDGTPDCKDLCPTDPMKRAPGVCGCGISDGDRNGNGRVDANDCRDIPFKGRNTGETVRPAPKLKSTTDKPTTDRVKSKPLVPSSKRKTTMTQESSVETVTPVQ